MDSARIHARHHAVQFYGTEQSLFTTVGGFLSEGLVTGQPALVIATDAHRQGILGQLRARLIDVEQATGLGDLVMLDADEVLELFMKGGRPDPEAFERAVGDLIAQLLRGRPRTIVRAYGEMVDVLWKRGHTDAAIALEILWNKLAGSYGFALLCGYSMGNFYKQVQQFQDICGQHTHIIDPDSNVAVLDPTRRRLPA